MKKILFSVQDIKIGDSIKRNIERSLKKRFQDVVFIEDEFLGKKSIKYKLYREIVKKFNEKNYFKKKFRKYEESIKIKNMSNFKGIDLFFLISGGEFSEVALETLKNNNPKMKIVLFLWDNLEYSYWKNKVKYFDFIFSYDRVDAQKNNFIFRPTFFIDECLENVHQEKEYILSYVGALRDRKRYDYIKSLKDYLTKNGLKVFFKLYVDKNMKKYLPKNYDEDLIITKRISYLENLEILKKSKIVLDIKYKEQNGLTLRAYESLATGTKLITDNDDIKNYDFYNENNVKVIKDINDIEKISLDFFKTTIEKIDDKIKERYTVEGFLDEIFNQLEGE